MRTLFKLFAAVAYWFIFELPEIMKYVFEWYYVKILITGLVIMSAPIVAHEVFQSFWLVIVKIVFGYVYLTFFAFLVIVRLIKYIHNKRRKHYNKYKL